MKERLFEGRLADRATTDPTERHRLKALAKSLVGVIREGLVRDGHVRIHGFGTFRLSPTRPRVATDPRTGRRMLRSGRHRVLFRPAKALRERVEPDPHPVRVLSEPAPSREAILGGTFADTHAAGSLPERTDESAEEIARETADVVTAPIAEPVLRAHGPRTGDDEAAADPEAREPESTETAPRGEDDPLSEETSTADTEPEAQRDAGPDPTVNSGSIPAEDRDRPPPPPVRSVAAPATSIPGHGPAISANEGEPPPRRRAAWLLLLALVLLLVLLAWLLWPAPPPPSPLVAPPGEEEAPRVAEPEPEVIEPVPTEPEIAEPEVVEPVPVEPGIAEPEAVEPAPVEPEVAEPEAVEPAPVEPEVAEPEAVEPAPVEPGIAEPEAVEPAPIEPGVAPPETVPADEAAAIAAERLTAEELAARALDRVGEPFFEGYEHTVQRGDTLWGLAERNYVNPYFWPHIFNRNEAIDNPDRLSVDQRLMLPTLYGDPRDLTDADRRSIAEGYLRLYRFWQREGHANAHYALVGVRYFDASVMPPDLAATGAGYPQDAMMALFAAQLAAHFGE